MAQAQTDYSAEKYTPSQHEDLKHEGAHQIAGHGHAATDMRVHPHSYRRVSHLTVEQLRACPNGVR
jgi:hypothetical protein